MYKRNTQGWFKHIDFIILDAISLELAFFFAYIIRHGVGVAYEIASYRTLAITLVVADFLIASLFNTMNNVLKRRLYNELIQTIKQVLLVFVVTIIYMFSLQMGDVYSRIIIFLTPGFHFLIGFISRLLWKWVVRSTSKNKIKASVILIAEENQITEILSKLRPTDDINYSGLVLCNRDGTGEEVAGLSVVSSLNNASDYICREWVDEVLIYPSSLTDIEEQDSPISILIDQCCQMSVPVHIRLPISDVGSKSFVEKVGGYNVLTMTSNYASPMQLAIKRFFDIIGGIIGSIIALFVLIIFGFRIKAESPGPILFKQERIGRNGKKFTLYKLRTMHVNAEEQKKELLEKNRSEDGMMFKLEWDPRVVGNKCVDGQYVTGIGEKIRRGSWDEWPQFFNVLLGQMSLVGTRPPTVDEWEKYRFHHRARLAFKPGITGLWQVSGRSKITDFEEVVKLDTEYIYRWGISLDAKIIAKTLKVVLKKDGAM